MDGDTERCAHCGTPSTSGARFCTNCGAQLGTEPTNPRVLPPSTDTAERVYDLPPPACAESPVFAAPSRPPLSPPPTPPPPPPHAPAGYAPGPEPAYLTASPHRRGPGPGLWIGAVVA